MLLANSRAAQLPRKLAHFDRQQQALLSRHGPQNLKLNLSSRGIGVANGHEVILAREQNSPV